MRKGQIGRLEQPVPVLLGTFQVSFRPEYVRILSKDGFVLEHAHVVDKDVGTAADEGAADGISLGWHLAGEAVHKRRTHADTFVQDGLEIGQRASFLVRDGAGDAAFADAGGDLGLEAGVGGGVGEEVEHGALKGGGRGVGASGELGGNFKGSHSLREAHLDPFVLCR